MKVEVQLLNERGRSIPSRDRTKAPRYRGSLRVVEARHQQLGRIAVTAELVSATDSTGAPLLPPLLDAHLLFLDKGQMRIRGFETFDGAQYGQTWDVKVS